DPEALDVHGLEAHVAVGTDLVAVYVESRVLRRHPCVEGRPVDPRLAGETDDLDEVAVELDDVARAGGLVQPVDVLGDHRADRAELLEAGHELVALVGPGRVEPAPADEAARPVPP